MTEPLDLSQEWEQLPEPPDGGRLAFSTRVVDKYPGVRIGRGSAGPAVLVETSAEDTLSLAPVELRNLSVIPAVVCRVSAGQIVTEGRFTVVSCTSEDSEIRRAFIAVAPMLLEALQGGGASFVSAVESLIELFRSIGRSPATSVIGLWGELFLMVIASNPDELLDSWHVLPNDRYDFASGDQRLEVKTTTKSRVHSFSLDQLQPPKGVALWVASIVTETSAAGASILELVQLIASRTKTPDATPRLITAVAQALGADALHSEGIRYDQATARDSLQFYEGSSVPTVADPPPPVSDVRFRADLTGVMQISSMPAGLVRAVSRG